MSVRRVPLRERRSSDLAAEPRAKVERQPSAQNGEPERAQPTHLGCADVEQGVTLVLRERQQEHPAAFFASQVDGQALAAIARVPRQGGRCGERRKPLRVRVDTQDLDVETFLGILLAFVHVDLEVVHERVVAGGAADSLHSYGPFTMRRPVCSTRTTASPNALSSTSRGSARQTRIKFAS